MAMRPRGGGAGPSRPGRTTAVRPVYETFKPVFERHREEEAEKLLIYLPGFQKENIGVSREGKTTVKVRGERVVTDNKWNRFLEEFQAPENCNMGGIHARFANGILTITMPIAKKIPPATVTKQDETQKPPIPPLRTIHQGDDFPPLASQSTTTRIQPKPLKGADDPKIFPRSPIHPKPLKGDEDEDDDFPTKTVQSSIESQKQATPAKRPFLPMSPLKGDQDDDSQKQTAPTKASFEPKPLKGTHQDDFPAKPFQISDENQRQPTHMEGPILPKRHVDHQDDFPIYKTLHVIESQKQPALPKAPLQPMLLKDYQDESPSKVNLPILADAEQGDQKSLEAQEKITGEEQKIKPLIGITDFVERKKSGEVKGKDIITQAFEGRKKATVEKERMRIDEDEQKEQSDNQTSKSGPTIFASGGDFRLGNNKQTVKGLADLKEERQLLVNAGVAVLVILALGAHIYNTVGTRKSD